MLGLCKNLSKWFSSRRTKMRGWVWSSPEVFETLSLLEFPLILKRGNVYFLEPNKVNDHQIICKEALWYKSSGKRATHSQNILTKHACMSLWKPFLKAVHVTIHRLKKHLFSLMFKIEKQCDLELPISKLQSLTWVDDVVDHIVKL